MGWRCWYREVGVGVRLNGITSSAQESVGTMVGRDSGDAVVAGRSRPRQGW
ncbi:putative proline-rich receptor-like protein kinase PERK8 [Iris pallida]|uniref:Proline-rich receptor-like protein kinase PERK8 n=1 Tax=Iris pallida TaxID=29817 RepID=A0AAX6I7K5_IRIPA|nr:putative proline-rich receptor-like protein kinase PERK8 [Iris pallida]